MSDKIYEIILEIKNDVGVVKGQMQQVVDTIDDHANKISSLETLKTQALTVIGIVSLLASVSWDWVKSKVFGA